MRQYELTIRIAQIHHLIEVRKYKKALAVVKTLDMRQVKGISDLSAIAEVYTKTEQFDAAKNTYLRIYKKSRTRRVLYRLIYLAIRTNALDEAEGYYQEFVAMNSSQRDALILRYRIDKASGASIGQLIGILESLKEEEYKVYEIYLASNKFNMEDFIDYLNKLIELNDPTVVVLVPNDKVNYDYIDKNIKTKVSDSIYKGIKILYRNKVYDFSLNEGNV